MPYALKKVQPAEAEADAAAAWYEEQKPGLGFDFLDQVDAAIAVIVQNPFVGGWTGKTNRAFQKEAQLMNEGRKGRLGARQ